MFPNIPTVHPDIESQIRKANQDKQLQTEIAKSNSAEFIANKLYLRTVEFQNNLPENMDIVLKCIQFGSSMTILVENIGYIGHSLVVFSGKDSGTNCPVEVIQHTSQISFLLAAFPKPEPQTPKRKIGFGERYD